MSLKHENEQLRAILREFLNIERAAREDEANIPMTESLEGKLLARWNKARNRAEKILCQCVNKPN